MTRKIILTLIAAVLFGGLAYSPQTVDAADSDISVGLFSQADSPEVIVTSPIADSIINKNHVVLEGSTVNTTDIDVYVNGVYHGNYATITGVFSVPLILSVGTNTITIIANSHISGKTAYYHFVVTYQLYALPSVGDGVSTTVVPSIQPIPNRIKSQPSGASEDIDTSQALDRAKDNLSFKKTGEGMLNDYVKPVGAWLLLLVAVFCMFIAITPFRHLATATNRLSSYQISRSGWLAIKITALLLAIIFATMIQA